MSLDELYDSALNNNIRTHDFTAPITQSFSHVDGDGNYHIVMDKKCITGFADEKTKLSHELGHCMTGSIYTRITPFDTIGRHEWRANKWAVLHTIPFDELMDAFHAGYTEIWSLAERFDVTEAFMRKAVEIYTSIRER